MMPKLTLNKMKRKAELLKEVSNVGEDDRPTTVRKKIRDIFYVELGITSQEKYLSKQAKVDVIRRIRIRFDKSINETTNTIKVDSITYKITRIYTDIDKQEMELSLAYVD